MPKTIKNDDGTEEEVYSKDELETEAKAKADEERQRVETESETQRLELQDQLKAKEDELNREKEKVGNWKALRDKADKNDGGESETKKELDSIKETLDRVLQQPIQQTKKTFVESNVGTDKEARDKFEYFYKKTGATAKTEEEVSAALAEALILTQSSGAKVIRRDSRMIATGADNSFAGTNDGESDASKEFSQRFGLKDDDKKKFSKPINLLETK